MYDPRNEGSSAAPEGGPQPPASVLIVDDEPSIREAYGAALEHGGFDVLVAPTGHDGLALARSEQPDVILLDVNLPDLRGQEVLTRLRADARTAGLAVIMISVDGAEERKLLGFRSGANDYLTKPVSLRELVARVEATVWSQARLVAQVNERLGSRLRQSRRLADLDVELPLHDLVRELATALGTEIPVRGLGVRLSVGGELAPAIDGGGTVAGAVVAEAARAAMDGPLVERSAGACHLHVPLKAAGGSFGVLSVATTGEPERALSALLDLEPQIAALLAPAAKIGREREAGRAQIRAIMSAGAASAVFQPIVSLTDGRTVGYEGLTRFHDGLRPDLRFQQARRVGLHTELELFAARRILKSADPLPGDVWVSINLSAETLVSTPLAWLAAAGPRPLRLEITEHESVADYEAIAAAIGRLDGVELGVDDAGSGYASLRHVYELRPSMVKLDRGWIAGLDRDPLRQAMIAGVLHFTGALDAVVVAEGVERPEERDTLAALGVPLAQGYLFARPAPAEVFATAGARAVVGAVERERG